MTEPVEIRIWQDDEVIDTAKVTGISHFHLIRDYLLKLSDGRTLELSAGLVEAIIAHEKEEE